MNHTIKLMVSLWALVFIGTVVIISCVTDEPPREDTIHIVKPCTDTIPMGCTLNCPDIKPPGAKHE